MTHDPTQPGPPAPLPPPEDEGAARPDVPQFSSPTQPSRDQSSRGVEDTDEEPFDPLAPPPPGPRRRPSATDGGAVDEGDSRAAALDPHREALLAALYDDVHAGDEAGGASGDAAAPPPPPARPVDPWAHRRGEPRIFAFFWSLYVLVAVAGSILWLTRLPVISATTYSPAARTLLVVIAAGICVLWPMTRLSQAAPERRPLRAVLADLFVVLAPVQMVVWPMVVLAGWPLDIVAAVASLLGAWAALAGGILALTFAGVRAPGPLARGAAMVACIAAALGAPTVLALEPLRAAGTLAWLHACSPFTGVFAVTGSGWTGPTTGLRDWHWGGILLVASAALGCWAAALARAGAGSRGPQRLH